MATSPIVETFSLSNTGSQVVPLLVVFHTPPEAVPTYTIFVSLSTTAKSSTRPHIAAGPISRNARFLNLSVEFCEIGPAVMGGRIDDFAVDESDPNIVYVGTASGGVWK